MINSKHTLTEHSEAVVFLGLSLQGADDNSNSLARRGVIASYSRGWLKPHENQCLAYAPHTAPGLRNHLSELVSYLRHRANLGNFECRYLAILFDGEPNLPAAAIDTVRPGQAAMLAEHVAAQGRGTGKASARS